MSTYPFREKLHVSTAVLIVAICLVALTIAGHFRVASLHQSAETARTSGVSLSMLSTPSKGQRVPMPVLLGNSTGEEIPQTTRHLI